MSRDTKRMNQTIRYAQQKLEPSLMHKMFFLNLYYVIVKSRKAITEILLTKYTMNTITNAGWVVWHAGLWHRRSTDRNTNQKEFAEHSTQIPLSQIQLCGWPPCTIWGVFVFVFVFVEHTQNSCVLESTIKMALLSNFGGIRFVFVFAENSP